MSGKINHYSEKFGHLVSLSVNGPYAKPNVQFMGKQARGFIPGKIPDQNFIPGKIRDVAKAMNAFYGDKDKWNGLKNDEQKEAMVYIEAINDEIDEYNKQCSDSVDGKYANLIGVVNEENTGSTSVSSFIMALAKKCLKIALNVIGQDSTKDLIRYMKGLGKVDEVRAFGIDSSIVNEGNFFDMGSPNNKIGEDSNDSDAWTIEDDEDDSVTSEQELEGYNNKIDNIVNAQPEIPNVYKQKVSIGLQQVMKGNVEFEKAVNKFFHNKNQHTHADAELIIEAMNNSTGIDKKIPT